MSVAASSSAPRPSDQTSATPTATPAARARMALHGRGGRSPEDGDAAPPRERAITPRASSTSRSISPGSPSPSQPARLRCWISQKTSGGSVSSRQTGTSFPARNPNRASALTQRDSTASLDHRTMTHGADVTAASMTAAQESPVRTSGSHQTSNPRRLNASTSTLALPRFSRA